MHTHSSAAPCVLSDTLVLTRLCSVQSAFLLPRLHAFALAATAPRLISPRHGLSRTCRALWGRGTSTCWWPIPGACCAVLPAGREACTAPLACCKPTRLSCRVVLFAAAGGSAKHSIKLLVTNHMSNAVAGATATAIATAAAIATATAVTQCPLRLVYYQVS